MSVDELLPDEKVLQRLEAEIKVLRKRANEITAAKEKVIAAKLVGKCFKFTTSYQGEPAQHTYVYAHMLEPDGFGIICTEFCDAQGGRYIIESAKNAYTDFFKNDAVEITPEQFNEAWLAYRAKIDASPVPAAGVAAAQAPNTSFVP